MATSTHSDLCWLQSTPRTPAEPLDTLPGAEAPELQAVTVENEKIVTSGFGSARWREEAEIRGWFGDWELVSPGLVSLADWRPDERTHTERDEIYHSFFGGVARKD